jgi:hypothetical protein
MAHDAKLIAGVVVLLAGCAEDAGVRAVVSPSAVADAAAITPSQPDAAASDAASLGAIEAAVVIWDAGASAAAGADSGASRCSDGIKDDVDGDGFTLAEGDCNDCLKTVNPAAYDAPGNAVDEDCSGTAASADECEQSLALASFAPEDGARAIGLCNFAAPSSRAWGVTAARYTDASGRGLLTQPMQVGILPSFGAAKPRAGSTLLALSSGVARAPGQPGYTTDCDTFADENCNPFLRECGGKPADPPPGYPKDSSVCKAQGGGFFGATDPLVVFNQAALELSIRVPSNANAFSFESIFYTSEYPEWICEIFNDFFVVFMDPKPASAEDGNLVFDSNHDPIGVNTGLLAVCDAAAQQRRAVKTFACEQGVGLLKGTGYGRLESLCGDRSGGASTGWLKTTVPVRPGQVIQLRFALWDTTDELLDSTALIDHFTWITFEGEPEKDVVVVTEPVLL